MNTLHLLNCMFISIFKISIPNQFHFTKFSESIHFTFILMFAFSNICSFCKRVFPWFTQRIVDLHSIPIISQLMLVFIFQKQTHKWKKKLNFRGATVWTSKTKKTQNKKQKQWNCNLNEWMDERKLTARKKLNQFR